MAHPYKEFEPKWFDDDFSDKSYRSIFKWGEKRQIKAPRESLYKLMKERFDVTDDDFREYSEDLGLDEVSFDLPIKLTEEQLMARPCMTSCAFVTKSQKTFPTQFSIRTARSRLKKSWHTVRSRKFLFTFTAAVPPSPAVWNVSKAVFPWT